MHGEQFDYTNMSGSPGAAPPPPAGGMTPQPHAGRPAPLPRRVPVAMIGCAVALIFAFVVVGFIGGIAALVLTSIKSSDLYQQGVAEAANHLEVVQHLGQPVEPGWYVMGSYNNNGGNQEASLTVPLSGPLGRGTLYIDGEKRAGRIRYRELAVVVSGSNVRIDLLPQ